MIVQRVRKHSRDTTTALFHILVLDQDAQFTHALKANIERQLPVEVLIVKSVKRAKVILKSYPENFFLGVTSTYIDDADAFEKVDLLGEFKLPMIVLVDQYTDEMRDQLIKRHVIDYVAKDQTTNIKYICDLIARIYKNISVKALIVDDSKVSRFVMARELSLQKFQVLEAANANEAIEILKHDEDIKLVLIDHQMPHVNGITLVQKLRETYSKEQLLLIGISTSNEPRLTVKFLKAGANDFISKPFNYETLLCRINQNMDMLDALDFARHLSNVDYLSGVYNRRYFFEQGDNIFHLKPRPPVITVIMIDIDFFKNVNDLYGHDIGDEVIKHFASLLKDYFRNDLVARLGGEEFAVLSTDPAYYDSFSHVDAFRAKVASQRLQIKKHFIQYSCSIGVTNIKRNNLHDMIVHADRLLYNAKNNGRNRIEGKPAGKLSAAEQSAETALPLIPPVVD
jgi:diguanylate cyclase (GGDEF)-like protein